MHAPHATRRPARWQRLQRTLSTIEPGQKVTVEGVAARTGLAAEIVAAVLNGLTRAELFIKVGPSAFVRHRLKTQVGGR